jgi:hypothetical protein
VSRAPAHPWCITAPWYRWPAAGVPALRTGRQTGPVLQKYDAPTFVQEFLDRPQHSLRFVAEDHWQYLADLDPLPEFSPGRKRRLSDQQMVATTTRKLFLPTHARFYLASCSVQCDAPGLPPVPREQVGRVGLVVRRRVLQPGPDGKPPPPIEILRRLAEARVELGDLPLDADAFDPGSATGPSWSEHHASRLAAVAELVDAQRELAAWASDAGLVSRIEGWVPDLDRRGVGAWVELADEEPAEVTETVHPMHALVPPDDEPDHDGQRAGIWFGAVPTGGPDLTPEGSPRFDDDHVYELRVVVERADPCLPGATWSRPSDRYLLAAPMDLDGTSHRPFTVKLPDIPELRAQMATRTAGEGAGIRLVSPPGSLTFTADELDATDTGPSKDFEICSFALPLITIVATFIFNLFLGLIMLVFNLWWMLALKLCIPPSLSVGAGLDAELTALPPSIELDASIDVTVDLGTLGLIDDALEDDFAAAYGVDAAANLRKDFSPGVLLELHDRLVTDQSDPGNEPSVVDGLEYEPHVDRSAVLVS